MPVGTLHNLAYRALLPLGRSPGNRLSHQCDGRALAHPEVYERLLRRHHVMGASLLVRAGGQSAQLFSSLPEKPVAAGSLFRVASITKMTVSAAFLRLQEAGRLTLDTPAASLLPAEAAPLGAITLRQLLSHTSGLRDTLAYDSALQRGAPFSEVLAAPGAIAAKPGETFCYCNFAFGLLGCILEAVTGQTVAAALDTLVLRPLGMRGTLDASGLEDSQVVPITRVLARHPQPDTAIPPIGRRPMPAPDPLRHFGHTAGALYTDARSLSLLLDALTRPSDFLSENSVREICREHAVYGSASPTLSYGLGMLIIRDPALSEHRILGHQGFAYGCADGAFIEEDTGRQIIFLNGGCSEARVGRLGLANRDVLRYALRKELPAWKSSP